MPEIIGKKEDQQRVERPLKVLQRLHDASKIIGPVTVAGADLRAIMNWENLLLAVVNQNVAKVNVANATIMEANHRLETAVKMAVAVEKELAAFEEENDHFAWVSGEEGISTERTKKALAFVRMYIRMENIEEEAEVGNA